ncbi:MAG: hypothetical protein NTX22_03215 [Ignavibacteriales bacterium]|nr:hypothetical protein [Ignavibacteriales bacterium]
MVITKLNFNFLCLMAITFLTPTVLVTAEPFSDNPKESFFNVLAESVTADNLYSTATTLLGKKIPITGNLEQLKYFFGALKQSKNKKVRIGHFGDSIIFGDVITEGLRENLQQSFGGNGAGFVSINTEDYGMRKTTTVSFSNDWSEASLFKRNANNLPLGINGCAFVPANGSFAKFETTRLTKTLKSFKTVRLFYNNQDAACSVKYSFNNGASQSKKLDALNKVRDLVLTTPTDATSIRFDFNTCPKAYIYGVSLENGNGVYVDNFPMKGQSGVQLTDITLPVLKDFNVLLDYKLIILNYGVNVISPQNSDYQWYETKMEKVINYLKSAFPNASILLVSVGDKSVKKGTSFVTDPGIPLLLKAQKNLAEKTKIAFWNLFEAMGGANSIEDWVNGKPQMALRDYCHLTSDGGNLVADLLTEALMNEFKKQ